MHKPRVRTHLNVVGPLMLGAGGVLAVAGTVPAAIEFFSPNTVGPSTFNWWWIHQEFQLVAFRLVSTSAAMFVISGVLAVSAAMLAWPQEDRYRAALTAIVAAVAFSVIQLAVGLHALDRWLSPAGRWDYGPGVWLECVATAMVASGGAVALIQRRFFDGRNRTRRFPRHQAQRDSGKHPRGPVLRRQDPRRPICVPRV